MTVDYRYLVLGQILPSLRCRKVSHVTVNDCSDVIKVKEDVHSGTVVEWTTDMA
jgi:hypothetical protein